MSFRGSESLFTLVGSFFWVLLLHVPLSLSGQLFLDEEVVEYGERAAYYEVGGLLDGDRKYEYLRGRALFYPSSILSPSDFSNQDQHQSPLLVRLTGHGGATGLEGEPLPDHHFGQGYGTYRFWLVSPKDTLPFGYGLYVPFVGSSYRLWVGGELLGGEGEVTNTGYEAVASSAPRLYALPSGVSFPVEVVLQVSNFHYPEGGVLANLVVGEYDALRTRLSVKYHLGYLVVGVGVLLLVYLLGSYWLVKRCSSLLISAGLVFFLSLYVLSARPGILLSWTWVSGWLIHSRVVCAALLGIGSCVALLPIFYYESNGRPGRVVGFSAIGVVGLVIVLVTPVHIFLRLDWLIWLYALAAFLLSSVYLYPRAMRRGHGDALLPLVSFSFLGVFVLVPFVLARSGSAQLSVLWLCGIGLGYVLVLLVRMHLVGATIVELEERTRGLEQRSRSDAESQRVLEEHVRGQRLMLDRLEQIRVRAGWHETGVSSLTRILTQYRQDTPALCEAAVSYLVRYLHLQLSAVYLAHYDAEEQALVLELMAQRGLSESALASSRIVRVGEGVIGSVFSDNLARRIDLEGSGGEAVQGDLGTEVFDYQVISSGLGSTTTADLLIRPLDTTAGVIGVWLLGRLTPFEDYECDFVDAVVPGLSHSILLTRNNEENVKMIGYLRSQLAQVE